MLFLKIFFRVDGHPNHMNRIRDSHRYVQQIVAPGWGKINQVR